LGPWASNNNLKLNRENRRSGDSRAQRWSPGGGMGAKLPEAETYFENNYGKHDIMRPLH